MGYMRFLFFFCFYIEFTFLKEGSCVELHGLKSEKFNGLRGTIVEKGQNGRWNVLLDEKKYGKKSFKPENLKLCSSAEKVSESF